LSIAVSVGDRFRNRRELLFEGQSIPGPKVRFASGIEDGDRPVTVELDFKDPIRRIKRSLLSAIIGGTKAGKIVLVIQLKLTAENGGSTARLAAFC
jgi:hypothetical protein